MEPPPPATGRPRLLVSVRNAAEAGAALDGGCDILDVKEPDRGSLGMADLDSMTAVVQAAQETAGESTLLPVSAALGEAADWLGACELPCLPAGLNYAKLGLGGLGHAAEWPTLWRQVRERMQRAARSSFRWIAVAYADWQAAAAPPPTRVIEAAATAGCAGVLFDTQAKQGGTLLDLMPEEELNALAEQTRREGLLLAVAGGLQIDSLLRLVPLRPDIVAIRTAGCRGGRRSGEVAADVVSEFRSALTAASKPPGEGSPPARHRGG